MDQEEVLEDQRPLEEQLETEEAEVQLFRSLLKSRGWDALVKILDGQAQNRLTEIMDSIGHQAERMQRDGVAQLLVHEFEKGVRAGILLVKDLPRAVVEFHEDRAREIREQMEDENG